MLDTLSKQLHADSVNRGFYEDYLQIDSILVRYADSADDITIDEEVERLRTVLHRMQSNEKLLLVISEVIEVVEAFRKNTGEEREEMADTFIRLLDVLRFDGIEDIDEAITEKAEKNRKRPYKHGRNF